jgi:PAS domain S-box-containing protein
LDGDADGGKERLSLFETNLLDKSGRLVPVQMSATVLKEKRRNTGLVCYFKDLRKKKILCDQWVQLVDRLNIGAFTIDLDRRITSFNYSAQALTGLKESEVLGKDCREVFHDVPCYAKCPSHVGGDQDTENLSVEITDQSDVKHLVTRLSSPLYGPDNQVVGCLTILQDHGALADLINRLNYEERSLKVVLDNLDIGIFTVNRGGHITFFNTAAEIISGYKRRQVLGRPCSVIFGDNETKDPTLLKEAMTLGESRTNSDSIIITQDGETIPIRADYIPLHSDQGKIVGGLATIQDLTLAHQFNQVVSNRYSFHSMIGKEPSMQKIFKKVEVVAKSTATVLLEGATGTGKDFLASVIHSASNRAEKPLVKVNCAALPDNLLESELFGYVKGAFTGADRDKIGRFQEADEGTIFLDEIGDLPLPLQAKLLRVLEDKEFYPLGARHTVKVDVRIISATNWGLEKLVEKRQFREDLYYRLNVIQIELPSLKERRADIPLLIRHIIRKLCTARADRSCEISKSALKILLDYDYPGNVRELQNILEHALIVCQDNIIEPEHLPASLHSQIPMTNEEKVQNCQEGDMQRQANNSHEREQLLKLLQKNNWHRANTARALGIDRSTLWRKMKSLGITHE